MSIVPFSHSDDQCLMCGRFFRTSAEAIEHEESAHPRDEDEK